MEHPITPSPGLIDKWRQEYTTNYSLARQAARWGADQELEACCEWCADGSMVLAQELRAARRPKPPSLAEQALLAIDTAVADNRISAEIARVTRAALERLQELEKGNE